MNAFGILWLTAVLYLGLATLPTSVRSWGADSKPARDYESAAQLSWAFQRADTAAAIGGESIIPAPRSSHTPALVLFHGLTNSPPPFERDVNIADIFDPALVTERLLQAAQPVIAAAHTIVLVARI